MITENLSTLNIHKLTREQYKRELEAGRIDEKALYLTPDEELEVLAQNDPVGTGSFSLNRKADSTVGINSVATGNSVTASGSNSHAEGYVTTASGDNSHAEGFRTTASGRYGAHAEGYYATASGDTSHAEGTNTTAVGENSHAEGASTNRASTTYTASTSNNTIINNWNSSKFSFAKGKASHVEGIDCLALGNYSHAEGRETTASGNYGAHAEGMCTTASGWSSHAESNRTTASGSCSHAEGSWTIASGDYSHAEGSDTIASGDCQHVQGKYNIEDTNDKYAHIVGNGYVVYGEDEDDEPITFYSNAHTLDWGGNAWFAGDVYVGGTDQDSGDKLVKQSELPEGTTVDTTLSISGQAADAKTTGDAITGLNQLVGDTNVSTQIADAIANKMESTNPTGTGSFSLNRKVNTTIGDYSVAVGQLTEASGICSCAEGWATTASGDYSHAEGILTKAIGSYSHAEGNQTVANGENSHAEGNYTTALNYQHAQGRYNNTNVATAGTSTGTGNGTAFVIGNGTDSSSSNAFRVTYDGTPYAKNALTTTGCDYAEFFEWQDLNPDSEDRRGYFVTLDGDKIKIAEPNDYVLGIVSGQPSVVGNGDEDWMGRYVFDEFGAFVYEEFEYEEEVPEIVDGEVVMKTVKKTGTKYKENPEYDHTREYAQRSDRPEWDAIGMLGVLSVRDDGTCQVNGYCEVSNGGIATSSETGYRVIKRVNDHVVKVIFR